MEALDNPKQILDAEMAFGQMAVFPVPGISIWNEPPVSIQEISSS
jgi:hypothetical protein